MNFNFTINAKAFADALSQELRVVPNKASLLILENFKLTLTQPATCEGVAQLCVTASNIDSAVTTTLQPTMAEGDGAICVNARKLTETVKKLDGEIAVSVNDNEITIKTKTGKYQLTGIDAVEFPLTEPLKDGVLGINLETEKLVSGLDATIYAVGNDDYRPTMKGVYMDFTTDSKLVFAATDTRKLAKYEAPATFTATEPKGHILPLMAANIVRTMFAKEPTVAVVFSNNRVEFANATVRYSTSLLQGRFPDYRRVIPANQTIHVTIDRNELSKAISRVCGYSSDLGMLAFSFGLGGVNIEAKDANFSQYANEFVPCDCSQEIRIGLSGEYVLQILNSLGGEQVEISMTDPGRVVVFKNVGDNSALGLLMPMSLGE